VQSIEARGDIGLDDVWAGRSRVLGER